ncbi:hypothetical protein RRG08_060152 [Elysia crispata]|uniref:Uncharacterized protein n=1 Tax=Elysia crispata TaxID=231223 RepID=A0AAE0ZZA9_9GAST|nr:hypothetical protein RRG08_060152 [Elysia crispata]
MFSFVLACMVKGKFEDLKSLCRSVSVFDLDRPCVTWCNWSHHIQRQSCVRENLVLRSVYCRPGSQSDSCGRRV